MIPAATAGLDLTPCLPTVMCPRPQDAAGDTAALAAGVASHAAGALLQPVATAISQGSVWVVGNLLQLINHTSSPSTESAWFEHEMAAMLRVTLLVALPILMAATIGAVLKQDAHRLARIWGVGLPVALLAGVAASQFVDIGLRVTDSLCAALLGGSGEVSGQLSASSADPTVSGAPAVVQIVLAVLTVAGGLLVWLELLVRSAGVYVATFFMPLALLGYVWPPTISVARRAVEVVASLVLSKLVIVAAISLGAVALAHGGVDGAFSGAAILLLAGFAPFALLKLAPVVEAAAIAHMEGLSRRPASAAAGVATHPVTQMVMSRLSRGSAADDQAGVARPVSATDLPMRQPDWIFGQGPTGRDA